MKETRVVGLILLFPFLIEDIEDVLLKLLVCYLKGEYVRKEITLLFNTFRQTKEDERVSPALQDLGIFFLALSLLMDWQQKR